ncbi:unnamed protein product [Caenorhabditis bovis]|uniref:HECT-type E3 ubiquitin transferase n=1 Tax=Caenorhabditis bovis TaxID=2654633 RepID=A0A8S1FED7_9PELO|nr:unnamed protein product [Caenorhabditis bovis]
MSFNLAFFNGDVKRDRRQEAMLRSMNERDSFLKRLEQMSAQRDLEDKKKKASMKIQKEWRRYRMKRIVGNDLRSMFDALREDDNARSVQDISRMLNLIAVFYEKGKDDSRLVFVLNEAVRISREFPNDCANIAPESRRLLLARCCIKFMLNADSCTNFFMIYRFFEAFITSNSALMEKCANIGYFEAQLKLMDTVTEPKLTGIEAKAPPPRCMQVMSRFFAPIEKKSPICTIPIYAHIIRAMCNCPNDLQFINYLLSQFTNVMSPNSPHFSGFLKTVENAALDGRHDSAMARLRLKALLIEQTKNFDDFDEAMVSQFMNTLAKVMAMGDGVAVNDRCDAMELGDEKPEHYLRRIVDERLESDQFRRIAKVYVNCANMKLETIVSLQKQFLVIVDTLAGSSNFMKSLTTFIISNIDRNGKIDETTPNLGMVKSAITLVCCCIRKRLASVADSEFEPDLVVPQFIDVLTLLRNVCLKLINLVHPDVPSFKKMSEVRQKLNEAKMKWKDVCDAVVSTLQAVNEKETRLKFLKDGFWTDHDRNVVITKWEVDRRPNQRASNSDDQAFVQHLSYAYDGSDDDSDVEEERKNISPIAARNLAIMQSIPFIVPFMQRVKIFSKLINHDRNEGEIPRMHDFDFRSNGYNITVRRESLYDDAFEVLGPNPGNDRDLRLPIRVRMVNWIGVNEAGVDGGGIFREFLNEVLKEGFDVNRGLFQYTSNRLLYPNPSSPIVLGPQYYRHYHFLGRMLGKLIYEKQLIELRFAEFFISQLLSSNRHQKDVDLQHMKSYDPEVFKHLRGLFDMSEIELESLQLDFSLVIDDLGDVKTVNLKPNGSSIRVTRENVHEYVRLYVNHHLKKRIEPMMEAMRRGISDLINVEWLSMFSSNEIQILIAGTEEVFSIDEMRKHCLCTNTKNSNDEHYIDVFWSVVEEMTAEDKKALLKFITGCSRPPIEGFQNIFPPLGILLVEDESLLPTSATCMNMLKLPKYSTREKLEEKLRYAINSNAGFELM